MGFAWRWSDIVQNPKWKGLTWGLIPLHTSGITACTYHLFYNTIPVLVPLQAFLTFVGNTTAAVAAYRIAISNGWVMPKSLDEWMFWNSNDGDEEKDVVVDESVAVTVAPVVTATTTMSMENTSITSPSTTIVERKEESPSLIGFEDLGDALSNDTDYTFIIKLFVGCTIASYVVKYGELIVDFPFTGGDIGNAMNSLGLALGFIFIPTLLNAFKWYKRSLDPTFEGWF